VASAAVKEALRSGAVPALWNRSDEDAARACTVADEHPFDGNEGGTGSGLDPAARPAQTETGREDGDSLPAPFVIHVPSDFHFHRTETQISTQRPAAQTAPAQPAVPLAVPLAAQVAAAAATATEEAAAAKEVEAEAIKEEGFFNYSSEKMTGLDSTKNGMVAGVALPPLQVPDDFAARDVAALSPPPRLTTRQLAAQAVEHPLPDVQLAGLKTFRSDEGATWVQVDTLANVDTAAFSGQSVSDVADSSFLWPADSSFLWPVSAAGSESSRVPPGSGGASEAGSDESLRTPASHLGWPLRPAAGAAPPAAAAPAASQPACAKLAGVRTGGVSGLVTKFLPQKHGQRKKGSAS